jgi:ubiquitin-activating enzyme E1 C
MRNTAQVLVIGAGGLGCEMLKNLALSGFRNIHVIDMDTIDLSNLNRQFLFREADIGQPKAIVAANFIMKRVPGVVVTPYYGRIQDKDASYYSQFHIILCGLDSVEARRWINATLISMVDPEDDDSMKPMIDGGTEGFKGHAKLILPTVNSCYECGLDMHAPRNTYPICTINNTPRLPEHCIEWASQVEWPRLRSDKLDADHEEHVQWLVDVANKRATSFGITGITYSLTQGVVKNIIPAIASTNAIIAAACTNEAFKLATSCASYLDNYMMYTGDQGVYTHTFQHERREDCPVCGQTSVQATLSPDWTLQELLDWMQDRPDMQLKKPSLRSVARSLYMQAPPQLNALTRPNLEKRLSELIKDGEEVTVTDASLPLSMQLKIHFSGSLQS